MSRHGHRKGFVVSATGVALLLGAMVAGAFAGEPPKRKVAAEPSRPTIEISSSLDNEGRPVVKVVIDGIPPKKLDPERVQALLDLFRDGEGENEDEEEDDDRPAARRNGARGDRDESEEDEDEVDDDEDCEEECEEEEDEDEDERPVPANRREFEMELRLHIRREVEEPLEAATRETATRETAPREVAAGEAAKGAKPGAAKPAARPGKKGDPLKKKPSKKSQPPVEQKTDAGKKAAALETRDGTGRGFADGGEAEWSSLLPLLRQQADQFRRVVGLQHSTAQESVRRSVGD